MLFYYPVVNDLNKEVFICLRKVLLVCTSSASYCLKVGQWECWVYILLDAN